MELRRDSYRFRFPEIARTLRHPFSVAASITIPLAVSNAGLFRGLGRIAGVRGMGGRRGESRKIRGQFFNDAKRYSVRM